jgi:multiple sugar transport system permease protein/raffinose/stachyose/melibiose transport system permease protein
MNYVLGNKKAIAVFLAPALLVYLAVMVIPVVWSFVYGFYQGNPILGFEFTGFDNFTKLFTDDTTRTATVFTLQYAAVITVGQIILGYSFALLYVFVLRKSSTVRPHDGVLPVVLPTVAVSLLFARMFQVAPQVGPVNALLGLFGIAPVDWFDSGAHAFRRHRRHGPLAHDGLLRGAPLRRPHRGSRGDHRVGPAGRRERVPAGAPHRPAALAPVLLSSIIFSLNSAFKVFDSILALNNGGPGTATTPLNLYMFQTSFIYSDYGYGSTLALLITVLCLSVTLLIFRSSRRDLTKA